MRADWKSITTLPPERIRVLTCDSIGFMQTGFYGLPSNITDMRPKAWYSDGILNEQELVDICFWDYLPECACPFVWKQPNLYS